MGLVGNDRFRKHNSKVPIWRTQKTNYVFFVCETEPSMYRQLILLTKTFIIQVSDHDSSKNLKSKTLISILMTTLNFFAHCT